jgi:hypothetical protein
MNEMPRLLLLVVGTYLLHSTLLLGGLWCLLRLSRGPHPRVTESLWKLAALAPLVTIPVQLFAGTSPYLLGISWRDSTVARPEEGLDHIAAPSEETAEAIPAATPREAIADRRASLPLEPITEEAVGSPHRSSPSDRMAVAPPLPRGQPTETVHSITTPGAAWRFDSWFPWLAGTAICVAMLGLFRLVWVSRRFHAWLLRCADYHGPALELLDGLLKTARLRRPIRLLTSEREREPAALGIHRWRIILPAGIDDWLSRESLKAVLAHELAHLVRQDPIWQNVGRLLCGCAAFQPLNFVAWRSWRRAAEVQCDMWAVQHGADRLALARGLTLMAERRNQGQLNGILSPAVGSTGNLSERVERLLEPCALETQPRWSDSTWVRLLLFAGVLIACCFLLPGIRLGGAMTPADAEEPIVQDGDFGVLDQVVDASDGEPVLARQLNQLDQEIDLLGGEIRALQRNPRVSDPRSPLSLQMKRLTSSWENLQRRRDVLTQLAFQIDPK